jgi:hypothetical protein
VRAHVSRPDSLGGRAVCAGGPDGHAVCRRSGSNSVRVRAPVPSGFWPLSRALAVEPLHLSCCGGRQTRRACSRIWLHGYAYVSPLRPCGIPSPSLSKKSATGLLTVEHSHSAVVLLLLFHRTTYIWPSTADFISPLSVLKGLAARGSCSLWNPSPSNL